MEYSGKIHRNRFVDPQGIWPGDAVVSEDPDPVSGGMGQGLAESGVDGDIGLKAANAFHGDDK